jgi:hypothetical protein
METSMLKTLVAKHRSTAAKMAARYKAKIDTPHGAEAVLWGQRREGRQEPLVARFGGIPLKRQKAAVLTAACPPGRSTRTRS